MEKKIYNPIQQDTVIFLKTAAETNNEYTLVEVTQLIEAFNKVSSENKVIITTEKDAMRLDKPGLVEVLHKLPIYYIPIETTFDEKEKTEFNQLITDYVIRTGQKK